MLNELKSSTTLISSYLTWHLNISPGGVAAFALLTFFAFFVTIEFYRPRQKIYIRHLLQSYRANIGLLVFNSFVMTLLSVPSLFILAGQYADKGLLNFISNPGWKAVISFLAIDLLLYLLHKASHSFDCLWLFHKVHHNDPHLNVSTAFRLHFVELLMINLMKAFLIAVLGIEETWLLVNEAIIAIFTMLHHTNISLLGEQFLGRVMITPYLHRVHHSTQRVEHDRNYGAVLSIWDRLFGTLAELKPAAIGINGNSTQDIIELIKFGFISQTQPSVQPANLDAMIAEAAYYKAEKRGFYPGNDLRDWLEAKSEIIRLIYGEEQVKTSLMQKWKDLAGFVDNTLTAKNRKYQQFQNQIN
jgi:sterol desaturase/sphingolipid hydroxylase (fatty acid hydroxylase superfamily)